MPTPQDILKRILTRALEGPSTPAVTDPKILARIEYVMLDCIGFVRHFLHLFHRLRIEFLDAYQSLLLAEPDSAVSQPLKEAFLSLRQAAESAE